MRDRSTLRVGWHSHYTIGLIRLGGIRVPSSQRSSSASGSSCPRRGLVPLSPSPPTWTESWTRRPRSWLIASIRTGSATRSHDPRDSLCRSATPSAEASPRPGSKGSPRTPSWSESHGTPRSTSFAQGAVPRPSADRFFRTVARRASVWCNTGPDQRACILSAALTARDAPSLARRARPTPAWRTFSLGSLPRRRCSTVPAHGDQTPHSSLSADHRPAITRRSLGNDRACQPVGARNSAHVIPMPGSTSDGTTGSTPATPTSRCLLELCTARLGSLLPAPLAGVIARPVVPSGVSSGARHAQTAPRVSTPRRGNRR